MLLIKPYLGCNLHCGYCYEGQLRKASDYSAMQYDLPAVLAGMEKHRNLRMSLHGGEPLCLPIQDVEAILSKSFELTGRSSVQTNGLAITSAPDRYIEMFKKYRTSVGVSFDGPCMFNSGRMSVATTRKLWETILALHKGGIPLSIIAVINRAHRDAGNLNEFKRWLFELNSLKIGGRLNPCYGSTDYDLPEDELVRIYLDLARFVAEHNLGWSPFVDIVRALQGKSRVCVFSGCDPFNTQSATVLLGDGSITNCMRRNSGEIVLSDTEHCHTRDEILENVPQEYGGCRCCSYFFACRGGCPASGIDNDWRNRTSLCQLWKTLFQYYENILLFCGATKQKPAGNSVDAYLKKHPDRQPVPGKPGWYHADHSNAGNGGRQ